MSEEILRQRLENHRSYATRQWQCFAGYVLLNGLTAHAAGSLGSHDLPLTVAFSLSFVVTSAVFFHLIRWTKMHIHRNAERVNELAGMILIELPPGREGIAHWFQLAIVASTACWLFWLYLNWRAVSFIGAAVFLLLAGYSFISTGRWQRR